jgi:hypothetical protein
VKSVSIHLPNLHKIYHAIVQVNQCNNDLRCVDLVEESTYFSQEMAEADKFFRQYRRLIKIVTSRYSEIETLLGHSTCHG